MMDMKLVTSPLITPGELSCVPTSNLSSYDTLIKDESLVEKQPEYLVVSPYTSLDHQLDLTKLDKLDQLLAKAMTIMRATREDYATAPYLDAFNWTEIMESLRMYCGLEKHSWDQDRSFYIIVFRSRIPTTTKRSHLAALDEASHLEAMQSGGLWKYWFGQADRSGRNLATCRSGY